MKRTWYNKRHFLLGWTPTTWEGRFVSILYVATIVMFFIESKWESNSLRDTFISFAPFFIALSVLYLVIGHHTSHKE